MRGVTDMRKFSIYIIVTVCLAIALSLLFVSSDAGAGETSTSVKKTVLFDIKVAHDTSLIVPQYFLIAHENGFDAEEGLNFVDVGAIGANELVASVVAGQIDVAGKHVNRSIAGINAGAKIKCVSAVTQTTAEIPHMTYVTLADSPIKTVADLKGKKVGLSTYGGCAQGTPDGWLKKNGISTRDIKDYYETVVLPSEAKVVQALYQGQVDVIGLHKDFDWVNDQGGKVEVLFTDYDVFGTIGGASPLYFREDFIAKHPDEVRRFVKVMAKTFTWINANLDKAREITAKFGNVDIKQMGKLYYVPDAVIDPATVQIWIDFMTETGEIKPGLKAEDVYTNKFNENAEKIKAGSL
jgi:ABC-type nitrate/sulfonate/bicarbonate transport system substrate-binding protein